MLIENQVFLETNLIFVRKSCYLINPWIQNLSTFTSKLVRAVLTVNIIYIEFCLKEKVLHLCLHPCLNLESTPKQAVYLATRHMTISYAELLSSRYTWWLLLSSSDLSFYFTLNDKFLAPGDHRRITPTSLPANAIIILLTKKLK